MSTRPDTDRVRIPHRDLAVIFASVGVFGIAIALGMPLLSVRLEAAGSSEMMIGLVAAIPAFGTFLIAPIIPKLMQRFGMRSLLLAGFVIECVSFVLLPVFANVYAWLVIRFIMGASGAGLFIVSETWINQIAPEYMRGRILAVYGIVLGLTMAAGPAVIVLVGSAGYAPFLAGAFAVFLGGLVMLFGSPAPAPPVEGTASFNVLSFFLVAPTITLAIFVTSWHDVAVLGMLPVYGLQNSLSESSATLLITAFCLGMVILTWPIGWLADHVNRYAVLIGCALGAAAGASVLPLVINNPVLAWISLFVWGGCSNGLYGVGMTIVGERFKGADLATAQASFATVWGAGSLLGPLVAGAAMDGIGSRGLPVSLVLIALSIPLTFAVRRLFRR